MGPWSSELDLFCEPESMEGRTMRLVQCSCGSGEFAYWEHDARGIELAKVCDKCRDDVLAKYRPDVLADPNYWADEPIDEA